MVMFVTDSVLSAVPGPKPKGRMITASNPLRKPGVSSWALVMRVKDEALKAAVRLNGMTFPPPPGVVFPSSHSANWAADPREGATIRSNARAQAPANLSRVIGILVPFASVRVRNLPANVKAARTQPGSGGYYLQLVSEEDKA